jgi:hypothetical protein
MIEPGHYEPTPEDYLWLLRAVEAEGAPRRDVAAALINRFVWLRVRRRTYRYPTLASFVRAYASPVNPRWRKGGSLYERAWKDADATKRARMVAADARRQKHMTRNKFTQRTRDAVDYALTNPPVYPTVTDFAAYDHPSRKTVVVPGKPGVNTLYTADPSWPGYRVGTRSAVAANTSGGGLGMAFVIMLLASKEFH